MEFAAEVAGEAGKITLRWFQTRLRVETKADDTPVTVADREAEAFLRQAIHREYPDDGVLGEEGGEEKGTSGYRWILDPIDGTKSFVQGVPLYGVLVALLDPFNRPIVGVVGLPALGEIVCAAQGVGCFWNGRRARVSEVGTLNESCVTFTALESFSETSRADAFDRVATEARLVRGWGDCFGHILVATGRAEVMLDPVLALWDCAPLLPILEEAGGRFTDWDGRPTVLGESGVSTNGHVHDEVFQRLADG